MNTSLTPSGEAVGASIDVGAMPGTDGAGVAVGVVIIVMVCGVGRGVGTGKNLGAVVGVARAVGVAIELAEVHRELTVVRNVEHAVVVVVVVADVTDTIGSTSLGWLRIFLAWVGNDGAVVRPIIDPISVIIPCHRLIGKKRQLDRLWRGAR